MSRVPAASHLLLRRLADGTASAAELTQTLGQSLSTLTRHLRALLDTNTIIRIGSTRGARYGLRRPIEGIGDQWPLYRVDENGDLRALGTLTALAADEYLFEVATSETPFAWTGVTHGLPYFLQDQRPAGFLGRAVPRRYPELRLPQRVGDWTDDHYLRYLVQRGSDTPGDLILGTQALDEFLSGRATHRIAVDERLRLYPELATAVMEGGLPGSSTHGEHPKFAAVIGSEQKAEHVLVKFSPPTNTAAGQRWSDLLVAEHLAHQILHDGGVATSQSQIHEASGRTFLEVIRFDRIGLQGRRGVTSLLAIDTALYGQLDTWLASGERLHRDGRIDADTLATIRLAFTFGALIANTDRHFGNLAFFDRFDGTFSLAPIYDMLPMLFAPEHDQVVPREFVAPTAQADTLACYAQARELAEQYWQRVSTDQRISRQFRDISTTCLNALIAAPRARIT